MYVFTEEYKIRELQDAHAPTDIDTFWVLDFDIMDYTLAPLLFLEEYSGHTIVLQIGNESDNIIHLPASWHILISDDETSTIDLVQAGNMSGMNFQALTYGLNLTRPHLTPIKVVDFYLNRKNIAPALNKHQQLCHPISKEAWINIAPSDVYNRYMKEKLIGDII
jgi:hypothetical protein